MLRFKIVFFWIVLIMSSGSVFAQETDNPSNREKPTFLEKMGMVEPIPGFIFNTSTILFDIDSYQGGFGGKIRFPRWSIRTLLDFGYSSAYNAYEVGVGILYQRPFLIGRIEPYWGSFADFHYERERIDTDIDNFMQVGTLKTTAGGVLGLELFIFDFISVFAEYQLSLGLGWTTVQQSIDGTLTENNSMNYIAGVDVGNDASLGLVIYVKSVESASAP